MEPYVAAQLRLDLEALRRLIAGAERVPRAALLNPLTLLDWEWTSAGLLVDGETVRTQSIGDNERIARAA